MAKESGLGHQLYVDGYDLSGDAVAVETIAQRRAALDVTGLDKFAVERISGLVDSEMAFRAWYNPSANQEHAALSVIPTTDRFVQYHAGTTVGVNVAAMLAKQLDYALARGQDASLAATVNAVGNGVPLYWGESLTTGKQTFASATNGTSIDYTAATTAFGATAFLQVFSVGSGTATVAVQDSADNSAFANVTGLVFTGATGRTTERLATGLTATIRRYLRVNVTGGFTNAVIAVAVVKFDVAQS